VTGRRLSDALRRVGDWPPRYATAMLVVLIVFGALAMAGAARIRVDRLMLPSTFAVNVHAELPGIDAATIETTVTKPLEQALAPLPDRRHIESRSRDGEADIRIVFGRDADRDRMLMSVRTLVAGSVPHLPPGMDAPSVQMDHSHDPAAAILIVTAPALSDEVERWVETMLADPLRDTPEVASVTTAGRSHREILIQPDERRLAGLGLRFDDLIAAAQRGEPVPRRRSTRRTAVAAGGVESVAARAVRLPNGESIALSEVASVSRVDRPASPRLSYGGEPALRLDVYPHSQADAFRVAERAHAHLAWLRANAVVPTGVAIHTQHDEARATLTWIARVLQRAGICIAAILAAIGVFFGARILPGVVIAFAVWVPAAVAALAAAGAALNLVTTQGLILAMAPFAVLLVGRFEVGDLRRAAVTAAVVWVAGLVLVADWQTSVAFAGGILAAALIRWLMAPWLPPGGSVGAGGDAAEIVRRRWLAPQTAAKAVAVVSTAAVIVTVYALPAIGVSAGNFAFRVRGPDPKRLDAILDPLLVSLHVIPHVERIVASNEPQETWRLQLDAQRMQAAGVGLAEVGRALAIARDGLVVGEVANADRRLELRIRLASGGTGDAFAHLLLRGESREQPALYLQQVGTAEKTVAPRERFRINGEAAVDVTAVWRDAGARDGLENFCDRVEVPDGYGEDCVIRVAPD
jgi:multidrug efflux pump subunit AcrB